MFLSNRQRWTVWVGIESLGQLLLELDQMSQEHIDGIFARVRFAMDNAMSRVYNQQGEGDNFLDAYDLGMATTATLIALTSVAWCQFGRAHGLKVKKSHKFCGKPTVPSLEDDLAPLGHHDHLLGLVLQT